MNWRQEIQQELKNKNISQRQFCRRAGLFQSELSSVINKDRSLSIKTALALELYFIKTAEYWLSCQLKEQIKTAKLIDGRF